VAIFPSEAIGSIPKYVQEFTELMHALRAHTSAWYPDLFPSRSVDGLKDEIKAMVFVHQLKSLESAVSLALLQEEAMDMLRRNGVRRTEFPTTVRPTFCSPIASSSSTSQTPLVAEDKRGQEAAHVAPAMPPASSPDDRASTLKSYRHSRGLCFVCGEK
jgi:hypothetical protein